MYIQHNISAATANRNLTETEKKFRTALERLSSGYRINSAADDAAGLTISEKLRWQIRGLERASENIQDGISLTQVADGALTEVHSMLDRMKELAVQAANDTNTELDRYAIQGEIDQIKSEINRISTDTEFNDIRIFKPTNTPEITGSPTDILVYHEDYNGTVREGGIIYNGKRYAYKDMTNLQYDGNGNIKSGTYPVNVYAEDGITSISINLIFDGGDRVPSGREYELDPRNDGIYIDLIKHDWSEIKTANGTALDPTNIKGGKYSFKHAGLTISFDVEDGMDIGSLTESLKKDGLTTYELRSTDVTTDYPYITDVGITSPLSINSANQDYVPGSTTSNVNSYPAAYKMHADNNEIYMYIDAANSMTGQTEILTRMTWEDLGLTEWMRYDPNVTPNWVNPGNNVSQGERPAQYKYHDLITGITLPFTVDSEVSKGELIAAINEWKIEVTTNNKMFFDTSAPLPANITAGGHSPELDAYGTQYKMGRDMGAIMTLTDPYPGVGMNYTNDDLSYGITDAKGKAYTFSSPNVTSTVKNQVQNNLKNYIRSYMDEYTARLNPPSIIPGITTSNTGSIHFQSTPDNYWMDLNFDQNLPECLQDSDFTTATDPITGKLYIDGPSVDNLASQLIAKDPIKSFTNGIVDSLKGASMYVHTNDGPVKAENTIARSLTTKNKRYSSLVIPGGREVKIQSGCLGHQYIAIQLPPMNTALLKLGNVDLTSHTSASAGIGRIDGAIDFISNMRAGYGATQNRLETARSVNDITAENSQAAESLIRDADMAKESMALAKHSILQQAGQSMLAQANHQPDRVLSLLS